MKKIGSLLLWAFIPIIIISLCIIYPLCMHFNISYEAETLMIMVLSVVICIIVNAKINNK